MSIRIRSFQQGLEILNSAKIRCESCRWFVLLGWEMKEEPGSRVIEGRVHYKCGCGDSEIAVCVDAQCRDFTNIIQKLSERIADRDFSPFRTWGDGMEELRGSEKIDGSALIEYAKYPMYRVDPQLWEFSEDIATSFFQRLRDTDQRTSGTAAPAPPPPKKPALVKEAPRAITWEE